MGDRGLGTGGRLGVDGASSQPAGVPAAPLSVREAQVKLASLGYDVGTPDGKTGGRTTSALKQFQASRGLQVTGKLDTATQAELQK